MSIFQCLIKVEGTILAWTPTLITEAGISSEQRNIVHELIGEAAPSVSLAPAALRTGTLKFLAANPSTANFGFGLVRMGRPMSIEYPQRPDLEMRFIATDTVTLELDKITRLQTIVTVPFQEIAPA